MKFKDLDNVEIEGYMIGIDPEAPVTLEDGFVACAGEGVEEEFPEMDTAREAAEEYVETGDWNDVEETFWVDVRVWKKGTVVDEDGEETTLRINQESFSIAVEPDEPDCDSDEGCHEWESPYEVLGGLEENPGCFGHGGSVILHYVCRHCGMYRIVDHWATDPCTGAQGLISVKYDSADETSLEWVSKMNAEDEEEDAA